MAVVLLHEVLDESARRVPDEIALITDGGVVDVRGAVRHGCMQWPRALQPSATGVIGWRSSLRTGPNTSSAITRWRRQDVVLVPLNQRLHPDEWLGSLTSSGTRVLIAEAELLARLGRRRSPRRRRRGARRARWCSRPVVRRSVRQRPTPAGGAHHRRRGVADRYERHDRRTEAGHAHPREPAGRSRRDVDRPPGATRRRLLHAVPAVPRRRLQRDRAAPHGPTRCADAPLRSGPVDAAHRRARRHLALARADDDRDVARRPTDRRRGPRVGALDRVRRVRDPRPGAARRRRTLGRRPFAGLRHDRAVGQCGVPRSGRAPARRGRRREVARRGRLSCTARRGATRPREPGDPRACTAGHGRVLAGRGCRARPRWAAGGCTPATSAASTATGC